MNKMFFFLVLIFPGIISCMMLCAEDIYYNSTTDGITTEEIWSINFNQDGFTLYAGGLDKQVEMTGSSDSQGHGIRISYLVPDENNRTLSGELDGDRVILTGVDEDGNAINKSVKLKAPFFSSFYVLPLDFINSDEEYIDFSIVEPLRSSVMRIRAKKEQDETLMVEGKTIETMKVRITLPGFLGAFWRSYLWYRKSDGVFVKSEETRGFPGTPRTYMIIKNL